jgi:hypothetical protein
VPVIFLTASRPLFPFRLGLVSPFTLAIILCVLCGIPPTLLSPRSPSSYHYYHQTRTLHVGISHVYKLALLLVEEGIITVCVFFVFTLACFLSVGSYLVEQLSTSSRSRQMSRSPCHSSSMTLPSFLDLSSHGQQPPSRISVRKAKKDIAEPLLPKQLKLRGGACVSPIY